jgi:putative SOS response-associated peptidase YedK
MCFHTSTTQKVKKLETHFQTKISDENLRPIFDKPNYHLNGFSHPNMLVIPQQKNEILAPAVWGIVPSNKSSNEIKSYYKEAVRYGAGLNARSEKIFSHFLYKEAVMERRCVIPVSGFFEPYEFKSKKYPFHFKHKEEEPLALAGLYTVIDTYITFTILTKSASPLFAKIHNKKERQPLILDRNLYNDWLSPDLNENAISELINFNYPEELLNTYPVSKDLFSPKVDGNVPSILERVEYGELS